MQLAKNHADEAAGGRGESFGGGLEEGALELGRRLLELVGVSGQFEPFVESVLAHLRASLGVPPLGAPGFDDPLVEDEFRAARARLLAFRADFEEAEARVYCAHLGAELAEVVRVLADPRVQRFVKAQASAAAELSAVLRALGDKMASTLLYEEPPSSSSSSSLSSTFVAGEAR